MRATTETSSGVVEKVSSEMAFERYRMVPSEIGSLSTGLGSPVNRQVRTPALLLLFISLLCQAACGVAQPISDEALSQIRFDQKPNGQVSSTLTFRDERGAAVRLGQYFGHKPVVLILGYYECPMLCTLVLNGMMESAADLRWSIGREFDVLDVSINPREGPSLAASKKLAYIKRYGRPGAGEGWHFLTGAESEIRQLAEEVGYRYVFDPVSKQYAHPSGLIVLTPEGKVSGYLFGVTFSSRELYQSLQLASQRQAAPTLRQLILLCFHYNPTTGRYSRIIIVWVRALAAITLLGLVGLICTQARRGADRPTDCTPSASGDQALHLERVLTQPEALPQAPDPNSSP